MGVGLAFIDVNIITAALAIGLATMIMVTTGSCWPGDGQPGRQARGDARGVVLIVIGAAILHEHLAAFAS